MSKSRFEFGTTLQIIDKTKAGKIIYTRRPIIPIKLHYSRSRAYSKLPIDCLLDSGADKNLFPAHIGEAVGIKINKGEENFHLGIGGKKIIAYRHVVDIICVNYQFTTQIDFSYEHTIPLLGREGFFVFFEEIKFIKNDKIILLK